MGTYYSAFLEPQSSGGFFARFLDFDDIFTEEKTEDEALFNVAVLRFAAGTAVFPNFRAL
jgi:uncharacterized protein (DUF608 family)